MSRNNSRTNAKGYFGHQARASRGQSVNRVTDAAVAAHFGYDEAGIERRRQANMQRRTQEGIRRARNLRASRQPFNGLDLSALTK